MVPVGISKVYLSLHNSDKVFDVLQKRFRLLKGRKMPSLHVKVSAFATHALERANPTGRTFS